MMLDHDEPLYAERLTAIRVALADCVPGDILAVHMRWCAAFYDADVDCDCDPLRVVVGAASAEVIDHWARTLESH